jgi:hypothetical protein
MYHSFKFANTSNSEYPATIIKNVDEIIAAGTKYHFLSTSTLFVFLFQTPAIITIVYVRNDNTATKFVVQSPVMPAYGPSVVPSICEFEPIYAASIIIKNIIHANAIPIILYPAY